MQELKKWLKEEYWEISFEGTIYEFCECQNNLTMEDPYDKEDLIYVIQFIDIKNELNKENPNIDIMSKIFRDVIDYGPVMIFKGNTIVVNAQADEDVFVITF